MPPAKARLLSPAFPSTTVVNNLSRDETLGNHDDGILRGDAALIPFIVAMVARESSPAHCLTATPLTVDPQSNYHLATS
ncbi:hypothetical protein AURDEDRAFT_161570 [Auricularia subglabra TFB-10046 SS5]|nr:hypothetical protein AURDEDRAFT_161570 [Auricularia subglabra TFB-10046 SS5]